MILTREVDLGEYVIIIDYNDDGSGYIKVSIKDELGDEIENIEIKNVDDDDNENELNPSLN